MRKTNPLSKLRFKPQVSAAFASVSILIDANCINPKDSAFCRMAQISQGSLEVFGDRKHGIVTDNIFDEIWIAPDVG
jgi:hypothetical protein